jgi:hypothetical protein
MSRNLPDRSLRRIVADLAGLHAEDISAVLGDLDAGQRRRIESLLRESAGQSEQEMYDVARVSEWLQQRIESTAFAMTPAARETLRSCAVELYPFTMQWSATRPGALQRLAARFYAERVST